MVNVTDYLFEAICHYSTANNQPYVNAYKSTAYDETCIFIEKSPYVISIFVRLYQKHCCS